MPKNDTRRLQGQDMAEAIGLLTRLPISATGARGAKAAWAWPLAGGLVALIAGLVGVFADGLGLTHGVVAALVLAVLVVLTGAMHEDGLADCADGFWGGWDQKSRLDIMKDSRIGAYGVIALILSLLARWSALLALLDAGWLITPLVATAMLSRAAMVGVMHALPPARDKGLGHATGRPDRDTVILAGGLAVLVSLVLVGFATFVLTLLGFVLAILAAQIALAKINGQTGDVLGATQQLVEIGLLAFLAKFAL